MSAYPPEPPQPPEPPRPPSGGDVPPPAPPASAPPGPSSEPDWAPPPSGSYGAPPSAPGGYGAPAAGAPQGYPAGAMPGPELSGYADWSKRAQSALIDYVGPSILAIFVQLVINRSLGQLIALVGFGWALYNAYLAGQTGQSYGKKIAGTRLVSEVTGQPIGGGLGIGRYFVHIIDALPCYVGFLWPLWDAKRQTFADKVLKTAVVNV